MQNATRILPVLTHRHAGHAPRLAGGARLLSSLLFLAAATRVPAQGTVRTEPVIAFPAQAERAVSVPFVDAVGGATNGFAQQWFAGSFDGDGRHDVVLLAGAASCVPGALVICAGKGHDLGRYRRDYRCARPATAAARFRTSTYPLDQLVYAEPGNPDLRVAAWVWSVHPGFAEATFLTGVGTGVTEMTAADLDGNGHDEIYLVRHPAPGATAIVKYAFVDGPSHSVRALPPVQLTLPVDVTMLNACELNGDQSGDVVAFVDGIGLVGLVHQGANGFVPYWVIPCSRPDDVHVGRLGNATPIEGGPNPVHIAVTCSGRCYLLVARGPAVSLLAELTPIRAQERFKECTFVDASGDGAADLVVQPATQDGFWIYPYLLTGSGAASGAAPFAPPVWIAPDQPFQFGAGQPGRGLLALDVDHDGDGDLLVMHPAGYGFVCARNTTHDLSPAMTRLVDRGIAAGNPSLLSFVLEITASAEQLRNARDVEIVVFQRDWTNQQARLRTPIRFALQPGVNSVPFYYLRTRSAFPPDQAPDGTMILNGDVFFTVHGITQQYDRFQSLTLSYERSGGNQSLQGVRWEVRAPPPLLDIDDEPLPWY